LSTEGVDAVAYVLRGGLQIAIELECCNNDRGSLS
jgi:hypothetical protein